MMVVECNSVPDSRKLPLAGFRCKELAAVEFIDFDSSWRLGDLSLERLAALPAESAQPVTQTSRREAQFDQSELAQLPARKRTHQAIQFAGNAPRRRPGSA